MACLDKGIMRVSFDKNSDKMNYQIIGTQIVGKPVEVLLSIKETKKKNLAVISGDLVKNELGEGYDLSRLNVLEIRGSEIDNHHF